MAYVSKSKRADMIRAMHEEGLTYEQIGKILGISKQAAHQAVHPPVSVHDGLHEKTIQKIRYVGLRNWMLENRVTVVDLSKRCNRVHIHASLTGKSEPGKRTIDAILQVTGLTYEECFKEDL